MAEGYGFKAGVGELFMMVVMLIALVLLLPKILRALIENTAKETSELATEALEAPKKAFMDAASWTGNVVLTPVIGAVLPSGEKFTIGEYTYGKFAEPPTNDEYQIALTEAKKILYSGGGEMGFDGFRYTDIRIGTRTTRFILMRDGKTIAPQSLPQLKTPITGVRLW